MFVAPLDRAHGESLPERDSGSTIESVLLTAFILGLLLIGVW
jgi:hypothetical protein